MAWCWQEDPIKIALALHGPTNIPSYDDCFWKKCGIGEWRPGADLLLVFDCSGNDVVIANKCVDCALGHRARVSGNRRGSVRRYSNRLDGYQDDGGGSLRFSAMEYVLPEFHERRGNVEC